MQVSESNALNKKNASESVKLDTTNNINSNRGNNINNWSSSGYSERDLLQQEMNSLHEEIKGYSLKIKSLEESLSKNQQQALKLQKNLKKKAEDWNSLKEENNQLQNTLNSREAEIRRLNKLNEELEQKSNRMASEMRAFEKELNELRSTQMNASELQATTETRLRQEIAHLSNSLDNERDRYVELQRRKDMVDNELEKYKLEQSQLNETHLNEITNLKKELRLKESQLKSSLADFQEYKTRAAIALQTKEKIIADLKSTDVEGNLPDSNNAELVDVMELRMELEDAQNEIRRAHSQIDEYRKKLNIFELETEMEKDSLNARIHDLESQLKTTKKRADDSIEDVRRITEQAAFDLAHRDEIINNLLGELEEKKSELERLKLSLASLTKKSSNAEESETGRKLRLMRETLVEMQMQIERLQSERTSLQLRLETELNKKMIHRKQGEYMPDEESGVLQGSADAEVQFIRNWQKLNTAANSLDRLLIRGISLLRHSSYGRLFVFAYLIVLHLWTFTLVNYCGPSIG